MVRENWFIVTLVTHSSGWAEVSTTSASIRWIRPSYMYPDESSRVVVYCLESRTFLFDICIMDCEYVYIWLYWWNDFGSSLPFVCLIVLCVVLLFCDDHQFIDVSINKRFSRSTGERWLRCVAHLGWSWCFILLGFLGLQPMYFVDLWPLYVSFNFMSGFPWHCGVPYVVRSEFKLQDCVVIL